jgi:GNAT superfamily N-acetyltransferase
MSQPDVFVRRAAVEELIELRHRVLRAGLPVETAHFEGDHEPDALHFAAELRGRIVGCCTLIRRPYEGRPGWQLRGMAVEPELQRSGIGAALLAEVDRFMQSQPPELVLWCNARVPASRFYLKHGWECVGEVFEIWTAGPHVRMIRSR